MVVEKQDAEGAIGNDNADEVRKDPDSPSAWIPPVEVIASAESVAAITKRATGGIDFGKLTKASEGALAAASRITAHYDSMLAATGTFANYLDALPKFPPIDLGVVMPRFELPEGVVSQMGSVMSELGTRITELFDAADYARNISESLLDALRPSFDAIGKTLADFDADGFWERARASAEKWGERGWVIVDTMPMSLVFSCPESTADANKACRRYALEELPRLRERVPRAVRKKNDAIEMFALFDAGHLKSCAMMACSLIDGELLNWTIAKTGDRGTRGKPNALKPIGDAKGAQTALMRIVGIVSAYEHFFRQGNKFQRAREGELNRNFLVHGMMNKPVSQIACIKLFLLLDAITEILPLCEIENGSGGKSAKGKREAR